VVDKEGDAVKITRKEDLQVDLLIIGGGTAGPMAALKAKKKNPALSVLIVDKATVRRGGSICRGMDAFNNVTVPGVATVQEYVDSIDMMSDGIADPNISRVVAEKSFAILRELEDWGVATFPRDENGHYMVQKFHPKGAFLAEMRGDIKPAMAKLLEEHGVKVLNRTMATRLFSADGRVTGAALFNIRSGVFQACTAKAVILCTGGQGRFGLPDSGYLFGTFDCPYNAGEGYSMVYHAGGELANMEYNDVSPMLKDYEGPGHSTFIRHGGYLVNSLGERFMTKYSPEFLERAPSGVREQAMRTEIKEGRGPIYYDLRHLPAETIELIKEGIFAAERPTEKEFFALKGIDIGRDLIELTLSGPNMCGGHGPTGALVGVNAETAVRNLYAAGDVASTGWGFVGAAWVFGTVAAEDAAGRMDDLAFQAPDEEEVARELARLAAPLDREDGYDPEEMEFKVRRMIKPHLTSPKNEARLMAALGAVERFREDMGRVRARDYHEVMKFVEVEAIIDTLEMAVRASLARRESRWGYGHYRLDYPKKAPAWEKKYAVVAKDAATGLMAVSARPVPAHRV
jgi:succinate dehydrogenase/fumarate reductase flavoprotein subunit